MITIYGLADSEGVLRYVGQTRNPLKRPRQHIANARDAERRGRMTHAARWILSLVESGHSPELVTLEIVDDAIADDRERFWIPEGCGHCTAVREEVVTWSHR